MLTSVQVISKLLASKDYSIIENNLLGAEAFTGYEEEFNWIKDHYERYGNVPDELSFLDKFPDFELVEVSESDDFLVYNLREQKLFLDAKDLLQKSAKMMSEGSEADSNRAVEYLLSELPKLTLDYDIHDEEIVETVKDRVHDSEYVHQNPQSNFIPTGFAEIDNDIVGLQRGDEFVVIVARINHGKSWVLESICTNAVSQGYRVGYFSPEMNVKQIGYRFDTLYGNVPNSSVLLGTFDSEYSLADYKEYAEELSSLTGRLYVTKPKDFNRKLTVSKLRNWIKHRQLDMVAIDGITYLTDERFQRGDSKTTSLTNISEDLMDLSAELGIPVLVVVQANRGGIVDKNSLDTPELENIKDSDGIGANASRVYSCRQIRDKNDNVVLIIENKKSRTGEVGQSYMYEWDINRGIFDYRPSVTLPDNDDERPKKREKREITVSRKSDKEDDVF